MHFLFMHFPSHAAGHTTTMMLLFDASNMAMGFVRGVRSPDAYGGVFIFNYHIHGYGVSE